MLMDLTQLEAAYGLLMERIDFGWRLLLDTYNLVDDLLSHNGKSDLSLKLETRWKFKISLAHCKAGRLDVAYDKLALLRTKGFNLLIYARYTVVDTFRRSGKQKLVHVKRCSQVQSRTMSMLKDSWLNLVKDGTYYAVWHGDFLTGSWSGRLSSLPSHYQDLDSGFRLLSAGYFLLGIVMNMTRSCKWGDASVFQFHISVAFVVKDSILGRLKEQYTF